MVGLEVGATAPVREEVRRVRKDPPSICFPSVLEVSFKNSIARVCLHHGYQPETALPEVALLAVRD